MSRRPYLAPIDSGHNIKLDDYDPADTGSAEKDESEAELDKLLTYAGTHALLIVLQGRDAAGKDGAIRKILEFSNIRSSSQRQGAGAP